MRIRLVRKYQRFEVSHSFGPNKGLELNFYWNNPYYKWFYFGFSWSFKGDHPGLSLKIDLLQFEFEFKIYDARHWNWEADRFYLPGEEQAQA